MEEEIDIKDLILALWRKKIIIAVVTCIFFVLGILLYGGNNKNEDMINTDGNDSKVSYVKTDFMLDRGVLEELDGKTMTYKLVVDQAVITNLNSFATSDSFLEKIINELNIEDIEVKDLKSNISIVVNGNSDILTLLVILNNKEEAIEISNRILSELTNKVNKLYSINEITVIDEPREIEENEIQKLEENIQNNELISDDINSNTAQTTTSGGSKKKAILVTAVGFALVCGVIIVMEVFDTSVRNEEQLEKATNLKTLAKISKTNLDVSDRFKILRVNVNSYKTILITSSENKDGKSFVSLNLAKSFARSGKNVLLTDVDYLLSDSNIKKAKESNIKNLTVLLLKEDSKNSVEVIEESEIESKLKQLEDLYDIIIIDSSNVLESANTLTIAKIVNNAILVSSERRTKLENVVRAKNNIEDIGGNVIGNVLNNTAKK